MLLKPIIMKKTLSLVLALTLLTCILQAQDQKKLEVHLQAGVMTDIRELKVSSDGRFIVCMNIGGLISLWDINTGRQIREFKDAIEEIDRFIISNNNKRIFTSTANGKVFEWDASTGNLIHTYVKGKQEYNAIIDLAITSDDKYLVLAGTDVEIIDLNDYSIKRILKGNNKEFFRLARFNPTNGNLVLNIVTDIGIDALNYIKEYDWISGNEVQKFSINHCISNFDITEDGKKGMALRWDYQFIVKNFENQQEEFSVNNVKAYTIFPDKKHVGILKLTPRTLNIYNTCNWHLVDSIPNFSDEYFISLAIHPDLKSIFTNRATVIEKYDIESGEIVNRFTSFNSVTPSFNMDSYCGDSLFIFGQKLWSIKGDMQVTQIENILASSIISPDGRYISTCTYNEYRILDRKTLKLIKRVEAIDFNYFKGFKFSNDNRKILFGSTIYDFDSGKEIFTARFDSLGDYRDIAMSANGKYLAARIETKKHYCYLKVFDVENKACISDFDVYGDANCFSDDGRNLVFSSYRKIYLFDTQTRQLREYMDLIYSDVEAMQFSKDNKLLMVKCHNYKENNLHFVDFEQARIIKSLSLNLYDGFAKMINDHQVIIANYLGKIRILDWKTNTEGLTFAGFESGDWAVFTPDLYWDASINAGSYINMVQGMDVFTIDQFAPIKNRPDIVLDRAGVDNPQLSTFYKSLYKKRLKRLKIDESFASENFEIPISKILETKKDGKFFTLKCLFVDSIKGLSSFNIYTNDVPLFGASGKLISGNTAEVVEIIELSFGTNKIEVCCKNISQVESHRVVSFTEYQGKTKSNLYLLAFGVSSYNDKNLNLQFADKDAKDLASVVKGMKGKGFENIYTKVLTNEQVTPDAIKAAKDFVKNAKVDDTFILFIAGHGMHDKDAEATYYYLTSNADINNLKGTAADFETIEDLLQGIPPRNKLFLMDACESGEIDDEEQGLMIAAATGAGIASRGFKTVAGEKGQVISGKRTYLYQKDRYIYNDLVRRSGAIVFSSSKGGELSYECSDIENGLFTEYIMKALTTTEADKDNNGVVSTDELRQYVSEQVAKASGDLQHPTVDRDNIYQKFGFKLR